MPEIKFPSQWLKPRDNVNHGDYIRFLDAGKREDDGWIFTVGIIRDDAPSVVADQKKFSLNKTNFESIAAQYGTNSDNWIGKEMRVAVVKVRNQKGQLVAGIRLNSPGKVEQGLELEPDNEAGLEEEGGLAF